MHGLTINVTHTHTLTFFLGGPAASWSSGSLLLSVVATGGGDILRLLTVFVFQLRSTDCGVVPSSMVALGEGGGEGGGKEERREKGREDGRRRGGGREGGGEEERREEGRGRGGGEEGEGEGGWEEERRGEGRGSIKTCIFTICMYIHVHGKPCV